MKHSFSLKLLSILLAVALLPLGGAGIARVEAVDAPTVVQVESVFEFTAALRSDGTVWTWGQNYGAQLGTGNAGTDARTYPGKVEGLPPIVQIAVGDTFVLARDENNKVWQWGCLYLDSSSQFCIDTNYFVPSVVTDDGTPAGTPIDFIDIQAGGNIAMALTAAKEVWTWGKTSYLGRGASVNYDNAVTNEPGAVYTTNEDDSESVLSNVTQIAGGKDHAMALSEDGTVYVWGHNNNNALGLSNYTEARTATELAFPTADTIATKIETSPSAYISVVMTNKGTYGWGDDGRYLGLSPDGYHYSAPTPVKLTSLEEYSVKELSVAGTYVVGLLTSGSMIVAGQTSTHTTFGFQPYTSLTGITKLFAGASRVYARNDQAVWTMGRNRDSISLYGSWERTAYNLLGNGYLGQTHSEIDTTIPAQMLDFENAEPPSVTIIEENVSIKGNHFSIEYELPPGRYDKVHVQLVTPTGSEMPTVTKDRTHYTGWSDFYFDSGLLDAGTYTFRIWTSDSARNFTSSVTSRVIDIAPPSKKLWIYLYGAPEDLSLTMTENYWGNNGEISQIIAPASFLPSNGYDILAYDIYPDNDYELATEPENGYSLSQTYFYGDEGSYANVYVVPESEPYNLELQLYDESAIFDGEVSWRAPAIGESGIGEYRLYFTDGNGNKVDADPLSVTTAGNSYEGNYYYDEFYLESEEPPAGAKYVQMFIYKDDGNPDTNDEKAAQAKARLWTASSHPQHAVMVDADPNIESIQPVVSFEALADESDIAFYDLIVPDYPLPMIMAKIPASGADSYSVTLPAASYWTYDELYVAPESQDGELSPSWGYVPIVDLMTSYTSGSLPESIDPDVKSPSSGSFNDTDLDHGQIGGTVSWNNVEFYYTGYDLFFVDGSGTILGGLARVYMPGEQSELQFRIPDNTILPAGTASIAVYSYRNDIGYSEPYLIAVSDKAMPTLQSVTVDGISATLSGMDYYAAAAETATEVQVTAASVTGVVYLADQPQALQVTATIPLDESPKSIPITVKSFDGMLETTYNLIVTKNPPLGAPELQSVTVDGVPATLSGTTYSMEVASTISAVSITATASSMTDSVYLADQLGASTVTVTVPLDMSPQTLLIKVKSPTTGLETEYSLIITKRAPDVLPPMLQSLGGIGRLAPNNVITSIRKDTTAGSLKTGIELASGVTATVTNASGVHLGDSHEIETGHKLLLSRGSTVQEYTLTTLKGILNVPSTERVSIRHVAAYTSLSSKVDVTGDGVFDKDDVRMLLGEIES